MQAEYRRQLFHFALRAMPGWGSSCIELRNLVCGLLITSGVSATGELRI
jgi:hypothetical protein